MDNIRLVREVEILHFQFFRKSPPKEFIMQYIKAHKELPDLVCASNNELRTVDIIIKKNLNALGIEPFLRCGKKRHLLSRKLLLISYLAECDAQHSDIRNETIGNTRCLLQLCVYGMLSAFHLVRGKFQKAFYGLL
jgi:hypothetical protein